MKLTNPSLTTSKRVGCGRIHMTLVYGEDSYNPAKIQFTLGKAGGCASSQLNGIQNLINLYVSKGHSISDIYDKKNEFSIIGIRCPEVMADDEDLPIDYEEDKLNLSCCDVIAKGIKYLVVKLDEWKKEEKK